MESLVSPDALRTYHLLKRSFDSGECIVYPAIREQALEPEEPLVLVRKILFISRVRSGMIMSPRPTQSRPLHTMSDQIIPVRFYSNGFPQ